MALRLCYHHAIKEGESGPQKERQAGGYVQNAEARMMEASPTSDNHWAAMEIP
jgi:hypothetical protein